MTYWCGHSEFDAEAHASCVAPVAPTVEEVVEFLDEIAPEEVTIPVLDEIAPLQPKPRRKGSSK